MTESDPFDPKYLCGTTKNPDKILIWGNFSYHGIGKLIMLPKNEIVNQYIYLDLLNDHLDVYSTLCRILYRPGGFVNYGTSS